MKFVILALVSLALLIEVGPTKAGATTIYSNLGIINLDNSGGPIISNGDYGVFQAYAVQFTPNVTSTFQDAVVVLATYNGGTSSLVVSLENDSNGLPGGTILESILISGFGTSPSFVTATSALQPTLTAGTPYWLVLSAVSGTDFAFWDGSNSDRSSGEYNQTGNPTDGPWYDTSPENLRPAFEIDGSVTSAAEPTTLTLLGIGIAGMAGYGWRRRKPAA